MSSGRQAMQRLRKSSFWRAVGWAYAMSSGQRMILLAVTFLLARLLGPGDFGTFAMAIVYILFIRIFMDQGFSTAVIQRRELEPEHLDSAFWIMVGLSAGLVGASIGLSEWWAAANDVPELARVITALSLLIPLEGLSIVHQAVLQRNLDFRALGGRTLVATLVGGACGIGLALDGAGVWALVAQQLSTAVIRALLLWWANPWRPRFRYSGRHAAELFHFSSRVYVTSAGVLIHGRSDLLLVGFFFGPIAAGIYHLAERLVSNLTEAVTQPLTVAALPHFSKLQAEPEQLKRAFLQCVRASSLLTVPAMASLAVASAPLVALLGPKWAGTAAVASILCVMGAVRSVTLFTGPLLYATSRPGLMARLTWSLAVINVPALAFAGFLMRDLELGAQTSGIALVRAGIFGLAYGPINVGVAMRTCGVSAHEIARTLGVPVAVAAGILLAGAGALRLSSELDLGPLPTLTLVSVLVGSVGLAIAAVGDAEVRARILSPVAHGLGRSKRLGGRR